MYDTNTGFLIYIAAIGLLLGLIFLLIWIVRRITWSFRLFSRKAVTAPNFSKAIRNLVLSVLWIAIFGMLLFYGFFFSAYNTFTLEEAVAQIKVENLPAPQMSRIELTQYIDGKSKVEKFVIKGDQWMLEGDILKWDNLLNFLGLHTRYRLTRIRGRYKSVIDEKTKANSVYSLVKNENDFLWSYLYEHGDKFPFVSTVYGNASFQNAGKNKSFAVFVGTGEFIIREK